MAKSRAIRLPGPWTCQDCGRQIPYIWMQDDGTGPNGDERILCFRCSAQARDVVRSRLVALKRGTA